MLKNGKILFFEYHNRPTRSCMILGTAVILMEVNKRETGGLRL
jgi:hypothetical protein